jgi:hypothetical protein
MYLYSLQIKGDSNKNEQKQKTKNVHGEVIRNHENANVRHIGQGEARYRKHKRLKLGGGQGYDRSSI